MKENILFIKQQVDKITKNTLAKTGLTTAKLYLIYAEACDQQNGKQSSTQNHFKCSSIIPKKSQFSKVETVKRHHSLTIIQLN